MEKKESGGGGKRKKSQGKSKGSGAASMSAVVLTVLGTIQAASIYTSTWTLPGLYLGSMVPVLEVVSFDFFSSVFDDPLAAPIAQLILGLLVIGGISFVFVKDDNWFYSNCLRYQQRRDRADGVEGTLSEGVMVGLMKKIDPDFLLETLFPTTYRVRLLDGEPRAEVQLFEGDAEADELELVTSDYALLVKKPEDGADQLPCSFLSLEPTLGSQQVAPNESTNPLGLPSTATDAIKDDDIPTATTKKKVRHANFVSTRLAENASGSAGEAQNEAAATDTSVTRQHLKFDVDPPVIRLLGHQCVDHHRLLEPVQQSDVFPYRTRRSCCAFDNGKRCGTMLGLMYGCPEKNEHHQDACGFALCEKHLQAKPAVKIRLAVQAAFRRLFGRGPRWVLFYAVVTVALALYTPVMRTCLMIVSCHPSFQCEFPDCWSVINSKFATAVYLSALMILAFGLAFPIGFFFILQGRFGALCEVFSSQFYNGRYLEPLEDEGAGLESIGSSWVSLFVRLLRVFFTEPPNMWRKVLKTTVHRWHAKRQLLTNDGGTDASESKSSGSPAEASNVLDTSSATLLPSTQPETSLKIEDVSEEEVPGTEHSDADEIEHDVEEDSLPAAHNRVTHSETVLTTEWQRFLLTDPSSLQPLYEQLKFESMRFVPVLHCGKFVLLIPPLLLAPNSLQQLVLIAIGEVCYAVLLEVVAPYLTVWMSLITLAGNVHQFVLVGLQAYYLAQANDKDVSDTVGKVMVTVTITYLVAIVLVSILMIVAPVIAERIVAVLANKFCLKYSVSQPLGAPLYMSPFEGSVQRETQENVAPAIDVKQSSGLTDDEVKAAEDARILEELQRWNAQREKASKKGKEKSHADRLKAAAQRASNAPADSSAREAAAKRPPKVGVKTVAQAARVGVTRKPAVPTQAKASTTKAQPGLKRSESKRRK